MLLTDTTQQYQSNLACYCRTGNLAAIPGIHRENIREYRRLVYNVVEDMLRSAYPLAADFLPGEEWEALVNEFFSRHACQSPQVWYMPKEFYEYLAENNHPVLAAYPVLPDLLLFEWTETELFMMEDKPVDCSPSGDLLFSKLVLNPEHLLLAFDFPVHRKNAGQISDRDRGAYYAASHRNTAGEVIFTDCSPGLVRILEYLAEKPQSVRALFDRFEQEYQVLLNEDQQEHMIHFLQNALQQQLISGFKNY
ncbi:MAG: putative DNA-binding domain-containing protein [Sphingobacteriales bacterium]|nr:putative DNA-binding domain-containing protein [Sphingobacteriales bacterium]